VSLVTFKQGSDIDYIREVLSSDPAGANIKIIAKIENQEGIRVRSVALTSLEHLV
jgi:pyruvate kinase